MLREALYAIAALIGAAVVVAAARAGAHGVVAPILGAAVCFAIRIAGLAYDLNVPRARSADEIDHTRRSPTTGSRS